MMLTVKGFSKSHVPQGALCITQGVKIERKNSCYTDLNRRNSTDAEFIQIHPKIKRRKALRGKQFRQSRLSCLDVKRRPRLFTRKMLFVCLALCGEQPTDASRQ